MSQSPSDFRDYHTGTVELTESDRHRLLADERRRVALDVLIERTTPVELEDLAVEIATRETDVEVPGSEYVKRVAIALHHNHLPMMAAVGAVDYEPTSGRIESVRVTADHL